MHFFKCKYCLVLFYFVFLHAQHHDAVSSSPAIQSIRNTIDVLTSDSAEGRGTGEPGQWVAAQYISSLCKQFHLLPLGDSGTYFQHFTVTKKKMLPTSTLTITNEHFRKTYTWGEDFITNEPLECNDSAPVYFMGPLSNSLVQQHFDSLRQSFLFFIASYDSIPHSFEYATIIKNTQRIFDTAIVGILIGFDSTENDLYELLVAHSTDQRQQKLSLQSTNTTTQLPIIFISPKVTLELMKLLPRSLTSSTMGNTNNLNPSLKEVTITLQCMYEHVLLSTCNIVGYLPGTDSTLKHEYIVITAHYDHLGKHTDTLFFPGANDNASGTAVVLEIARQLSQIARRSRSFIFVYFTGEEHGLLGSKYFITNPPVPLRSIVGVINVDMVGRNDEDHTTPHYIYVIGSTKVRSNLDSIIQSANRETVHFELDYRYNDDSDPHKLLWRSDHSVFLLRGIPSVFFFGGFHADYHEQTDTKEKLDLQKLDLVVRLVLQVAMKLSHIGTTLHTIDK
ncbi:MAG: M28 family peptidase [Bacteroidetes bacterium]|nr:M28 family peptidase [Bacteroidota bacterium]